MRLSALSLWPPAHLLVLVLCQLLSSAWDLCNQQWEMLSAREDLTGKEHNVR